MDEGRVDTAVELAGSAVVAEPLQVAVVLLMKALLAERATTRPR
jgi:hypothetical protein